MTKTTIADIRLGQHWVGSGQPPLIIAELSGNHDQSLDKALAMVDAAAKASQTPLQRIGRISAAPGLRVLDASGHPVAVSVRGFDHFA